MSQTGSLKTFMDGKGFGFIERDDGVGDVFVHVRQLSNGGADDMVVGTKFSFDIEPDERSGKQKAVNVTITQPGNGARPSGGGGGGKGSDQPCGDFLRGSCTRDRCRYSHDTGGGGGGGGNRFAPYGGGAPAPAYGGAPAQAYGGAPAYGGGYGAPPPAASPALPAGWEMVNDPSSGKPYYCNRATGQTSWEPPAAAPMLPPGWESVNDPASGKTYYCNRATGQSSWDLPRA